MLFYIVSEGNQGCLDSLRESYIMNKEIKAGMSQDAFMKYIKKDLRNLEIDILIIDIRIFDLNEELDLCDAADAFFLLNPESKIIILPSDNEYEEQLYEPLGQYQQLYIIRDKEMPAIEVNHIISEKAEMEEERADIEKRTEDICDQSNVQKQKKKTNLKEAEDVREKKEKAIIQKQRYIREQEEEAALQEQKYVQEKKKEPTLQKQRDVKEQKEKVTLLENEDIQEQKNTILQERRDVQKLKKEVELSEQRDVQGKKVESTLQNQSDALSTDTDIKLSKPLISITSVDQIYSKAAAPVKVSEGLPLKKRVRNSIIKETAGEPLEKKQRISEKASAITEIQAHPDKEDEIVTSKISTDKSDPEAAPVAMKPWSNTNVMIGIVGTERKAGTTTAAFHLANYLNNLGASVTYTETNLHNHLSDIAEAYHYEWKDDHYTHNGITYYLNTAFDTDARANFILFDLGCMMENKKWILKSIRESMMEIIVISGSKPYELHALRDTLDTVQDKKINLLLNYVSKDDKAKLFHTYSKQVKRLASLSYEPDLNKPGDWPETFIELFYKYR